MFDIQFLCATIFPKNLDVCSFLGYNIFVIDMFFEVFSSGTFYKRKGLFYNNIGLPAASTTVPSLSVPSLRGSVPPWRAQRPQQNQEPVEVAEQQPVVATSAASEPAASPTSRSRSRAPSVDTAPALAAPRASRGREANISNEITPASRRDLKRASSVPVPRRSKGAAVPDTPRPLEPLPPPKTPKAKLPWKAPPVQPPKPDRPAPAPPNPAKPVKHPPPGVEKVRRPGVVTSSDPLPLGTEERPPKASEESSGSGLAPHIRGRPLPEPTPESAEGVAGPRPRRYQEPTRLVSQVVHIDSSKIP